MARAQAVASPVASPGAASGSVMRQNASNGRSPSKVASCSIRASTEEKAACAPRM